MFNKILIANRGEIACRIIRTLDRMGIGSVAVYSEADANSLHVSLAGEAVCIGPPLPAESYLRAEKILEVARVTGSEAIHPGYGFLSENPGFAEACAAGGIAFIGPTPEQMRAFGLKHSARLLAERAGVPLAPGSGLLDDVAHAKREALRIGYPVMIKSTAGGGGIGLQLCRGPDQMEDLFGRVARLARGNFDEAGIFLEKYVEQGRHIEVQIFGDGKGRVVALGERDCSTQRRNQKVIEETPAPGLTEIERAALHDTAVRLGEAVHYASAGTVEFIYDITTGEFYFLEVNTRLQVEHGVTEQVTGVDLVEWMIRQAAGESLTLTGPAPCGASIQVRLYAEDPARDFRPSSGLLTRARFPTDARIETWVEDGSEITPFYDPLIAKIIVTGNDRAHALTKLSNALAETTIAGIETNLDYLRQLAVNPLFTGGGMTTRALERFAYAPRTIEVLVAGTQTTIQDYPGRTGYWHVGVPPSGPMDHVSFRLANVAVGNAAGASALEMTLSGPTLKFNTGTLICLTGAEMAAELDGGPVTCGVPLQVPAGAMLRIGPVKDAGCRAYLAVQGGFDVPDYLGSRATFTLGKFGGHGGRALIPGDVLHLGSATGTPAPRQIPPELLPVISHDWEMGVLYGPHGAPDFFTEDDIATFFAATWEVHYNSNRTGVRLIGPKPKWARSDGGEAGLHPSNIHDNAYAIGAVDFTGDMPVILGPDGPSLGGFVCPVTVVQAELWKIGQLRPNDRVRFRRLTPDEAALAEQRQEMLIAGPTEPMELHSPQGTSIDAPILSELPGDFVRPSVTYRRAGDKYLLVEYGPLVLDLELRFRVHALMGWVEKQALSGIIDLTPGIRSLQIHYDSRILSLEKLLGLLRTAEEMLPPVEDMVVPTRVVRLPLSWDDEATKLAIAKYMQSVRPDAPWCPSNIEFIRRINGLDTIEDVKRVVFDASYLVLGLGDVYLGAPVATPIDPRQRLVTTKYNPARTWTPENAVGIGGAYMCVYGMEGPGGYQFVGRTCQMWNTYRVTAEFPTDRPWLLRFFDQVRFYPVSGEELLKFRADFLHGRVQLDIVEDSFSLKDYRRFQEQNADGIRLAKARQQSAFDAERARWEESGQLSDAADPPEAQDDATADELPPGCEAIVSPVSGSVWRVTTEAGQALKSGEAVVVVESMKMEMQVSAPTDGTVVELCCSEGRAVTTGQRIVIFRPDTANSG
ncbi:MAG: accA [Rhodospirillales bacterium]|nr:accA [Rhodospirillales bacterium]